MKKFFYLLLCSGIILAACDSPSKDKPVSQSMTTSLDTIPFKKISNDTASKMIALYNLQPPKGDTNYREVPRVMKFDPKQLNSLTATNKEGEVVNVYFIIASYLDKREIYSKNTVLAQIVRSYKDKKTSTFYDLRELKKSLGVGSGVLCPPPPDCIPPDNSK
jgi:hypothetical protein